MRLFCLLPTAKRATAAYTGVADTARDALIIGARCAVRSAAWVTDGAGTPTSSRTKSVWIEIQGASSIHSSAARYRAMSWTRSYARLRYHSQHPAEAVASLVAPPPTHA